MPLATLSIDLEAKTAQFAGDMGKAARASEQTAQRINAAFGTVKATLGGLASGVSVGFLVDVVRASVDSVDALNDVADATGATIAKISALDDLSARTGGNLDTVSTSLLKLNKVLTEATPGSQQEAILKSIGLSAQQLRALDPADALLQVAKALDQYEDGGKKARLMQELLGKSTKDLSSLLKDLAEKGELVGTVTKEQADEAERFNKQVFEMQANVKAVSRSLSIDLVTGINATVKAFKDGEAAGKSYFSIALSRYWENVAAVYGTTGDAADGYRKRLAEIDTQLNAGESRLLVRNALLREQAALQAKLSATPVGAASDQSGAESSRLGRKLSLPDLPPDGKGATSAAKAAVDAAKRAQEERIRAGRELATAIGNAVTEGNDMLAKLQADEARIAEADAKRTADYLRSLQDGVNAVAEGNAAMVLQVQSIGLTKEALDALVLARMDDAIAQKEQTLATAAANGKTYEEISLMEQEIALLKERRTLTATGQVATAAAESKEKSDKASKEFADTLHTDLKGAFSAAFRDTEGDALKAFGDALENMVFTRAATALSDAVADGASAQLGASLGGKGGGGLGDGVGAWLASLFSFDGGGSTGPGARSGGVDGKGGFLAVMHPNETVIDHTKGQSAAAGGGGGVSIYQTFHIDSRSDMASIMAAVRQGGEITKAEILKSRQRGGVFA